MCPELTGVMRRIEALHRREWIRGLNPPASSRQRAAFTTFASLLFSLWQLQFAPESEVAAHKEAADKYYSLRSEFRTLGARMMTLIDEELESTYERLMRQLNELTAASPRTSKKAYRLTREKD